MSATVADEVKYAEAASRLRIAIARLARQLRQESHGGLSLSQWSALVTIEENEPVRIGDLAEREGVSAPTATRVVATLEDDGLLSRTSNPADRRTAYVALTPLGREKLEWARNVRTASLAQRLAGLPDVDVDRLLELVSVLESFVSTP
ncbi:MAG TPA: MarR family transcriptional regulator [Mycobacteriales bacterium]|nr:MarR family transcriptional regulator [Mycobacteriales bacterium]